MENSSSKKKRKIKSATEAVSALAVRVQALLRLAPSSIDVDAIGQLLGNPSPLRTQQQVGEVFGQSTNTIQRSWRSNRMPGTAGAWPVPEILAWYLERERRNNTPAPSANGHAVELQGIELESARAMLDIRQAKARRETGLWVPLSEVRRAIKGILNVQRDAFLGIPQRFKPRFPLKFAEEWTTDLDREIRNVLHILAEKPIQDIIEASKRDGDAEETELGDEL